jgi:23S rRNA (cytidine2498-2'-O)-methyltransferase
MKNLGPFVFVWTNSEAVHLLKNEINNYYPQLKLAYGQKAFITFKNTDQDLAELQLAFAHIYGSCQGKITGEQLSQLEHYILIDQHKIIKIGQSNFKTIIFKIKPDEFWLGEVTDHQQNKFKSYLANFELNKISRAYFKLSQSFQAFNKLPQEDQRVLELGSSPGGASQYLLEQGCMVDAIDPAQMDNLIINHPKLNHIKKPLEKLTDQDVKPRYDWIVSDINLPFDIIFHHLINLNLEVNLGMFLTVKIQKTSEMKKFEAYISKLKMLGFTQYGFCYLHNHRQETMLYAFKP